MTIIEILDEITRVDNHMITVARKSTDTKASALYQFLKKVRNELFAKATEMAENELAKEIAEAIVSKDTGTDSSAESVSGKDSKEIKSDESVTEVKSDESMAAKMAALKAQKALNSK